MRKQLLCFEPAEHLMPLLSAFRLPHAEGATSGFDLGRIERALVHRVMGISPRGLEPWSIVRSKTKG